MILRRILTAIAVLSALSLTTADARTAVRDLIILGWVENVYLTDPGLELKAKMDSGAETSSLDARIVKKFRKGGKRWVRFTLVDPATGEEYVMVRERVRTISVVRHEGDNQVRPTVMIQVCVADRLLDIEVSLIDRSEFSYRLLLGRRALKSVALVDPGNTYLTQPKCNMVATDSES